MHDQLGEVHGLAIGASALTEQVQERVRARFLQETLRCLQDDAARTRERCLALEQRLGETPADLVGAWFKAGTGPVAAWTFLAMGEAAEVAAWRALAGLSSAARDAGPVRELCAWALPIQERHLELALEGAALLGRRLDP